MRGRARAFDVVGVPFVVELVQTPAGRVVALDDLGFQHGDQSFSRIFPGALCWPAAGGYKYLKLLVLAEVGKRFPEALLGILAEPA